MMGEEKAYKRRKKKCVKGTLQASVAACWQHELYIRIRSFAMVFLELQRFAMANKELFPFKS
jgi:hypothetical protein